MPNISTSVAQGSYNNLLKNTIGKFALMLSQVLCRSVSVCMSLFVVAVVVLLFYVHRKHLRSRSGGGVVDNTLDYQSRGRKIDPPLLRSFG